MTSKLPQGRNYSCGLRWTRFSGRSQPHSVYRPLRGYRSYCNRHYRYCCGNHSVTYSPRTSAWRTY